MTVKDIYYPQADKHMHIPLNSNIHVKMSHLINRKILELDKDKKWQNDIISIILQPLFIQKKKKLYFL